MILAIEESDFDRVLTRAEVETMRSTEDVAHLGLGGQQIRELLVKVVAKKLEALVPEGFGLSEVRFALQLEGKVFGAGVGGEVHVTLKKQT